MDRKKVFAKVKRYPTDLNDKKWEILSTLLPVALLGGRPRTKSLRKVINEILYITQSGCAWRLRSVFTIRWGLESGKKQSIINIPLLAQWIVKV